MASSDQGGTGEHVLLEVLIAQLRRNGMLTPADTDNMNRRLIEGGDEDAADRLGMILFSDIIDDPDARRASIHAIGGGNEGD